MCVEMALLHTFCPSFVIQIHSAISDFLVSVFLFVAGIFNFSCFVIAVLIIIAIVVVVVRDKY